MKTKHLFTIILLLLAGRMAYAQAPVITSYTPTVGAVGTLVTVKGSNLANAQSFNIGGKAAVVVSNTSTRLVGMVMPGAVSGTVAVATTGGSVNAAASFTIATNGAPVTQQGNRFTAANVAGGSYLGSSVAVSADGATAIVGAPSDNNLHGIVRVFKLNGTQWVIQSSNLTDPNLNNLGTDVAISADGNTVMASGSINFNNQWKALFFIRQADSTWIQQGPSIVSPDAASQVNFSSSVALSADGNTAVIGASDPAAKIKGYVYTRTGDTWSQQGNALMAVGLVGDKAGAEVAMSANGNTILAGNSTYGNNEGALSTGCFWVFTQNGSTWTQQGAKLTTAGGASLAKSLALSADGNTALAGGYGYAAIFTRTGTTWSQFGNRFSPGDSVEDADFGHSVSLSADGNTAVVGGDSDNSYIGASWVFLKLNGIYTQYGNKLIGTGAIGTRPSQGFSISISANGGTLLTGAIRDNNRGACWAFSGLASVTKQSQAVVFNIPATLTYGDADFVPATSSAGLAVTVTSSNTAVATIVAGKLHIVGAGNATITVTQAGNVSVRAAPVSIRAIVVNKKALTITADNKTVISGDAIPPLTVTYAGFITGETAANLTTAPVAVTSAVAASPIGTYAINVSGAVAGNYSFVYKPGVLTIQQPPLVSSVSPVSGPVGTLVTLTGNNLSSPTSFTIGGVPALIISNNGTKLVAMVMPGAATGTLNIAANGFTYQQNFAITGAGTPNMPLGNRLSANDLAGNSGQGLSVAVSADGATVIVGGYADDTNKGAAWIYRLSNGSWALQSGKLLGNDAVGATVNQGKSVAISADGNTAIVGGYNDNTGIGAAWVYVRQPNLTWVQQGSKLVGTGMVGAAGFGYSVALSADGNTAVIGAYHDDGSKGAAWIFARSGTTWLQQGTKLLGTGGLGNGAQGSAVAISANGNTAMVSGFNDNGGIGSAWIYNRSGSAWAQQGNKLVGTGYTGIPHMGFGVSLSADGNLAMIGGPNDNTNQGAAWLFTRTGSTWAQTGNKITATGGTGTPGFGKSVSLNADAGLAAIGGYLDNSSIGATWLFKMVSGAYIQQGNKITSVDAIGAAQQGSSVSISASGSTLIVGGPGHKSGKGAAWTFSVVPPPVIASFSPSSGPVGTLVTINGSNLSSNTAFTIGNNPALTITGSDTKLVAMVMPGAVSGPISITTGTGANTSGDTFTVTNPSAPITQQGAKLTANDATGEANQGSSVALNANGTTAIVGGNYNAARIGAAWIYELKNGNWTKTYKLVGAGSGELFQGSSVAISADGNTALVTGLKSAWFYVRQPDSSWVQQDQVINNPGGAGFQINRKGSTLSADGNTAIFGTFTTYAGNSDEVFNGSVVIYTRKAGFWTQLGSTISNIGGASVAISADGKTFVTGGYGGIWFYTRQGDVWTQQGGKLTQSTAGNLFGASVALSADGNTAAIGGGGAWVFTRNGNTWTQYGGPVTSSNQSAYGRSICLSADGKTLVTGSSGRIGGTLVFKNIDNVWTQQGSELLGSGYNPDADYDLEYQGYATAISANGTKMFVGGKADAAFTGATWAFYSAPDLQTQSISFAKPFALTSIAEESEGNASATSGLPITYTSSDPKIATVVNGRIRMLNRGTVTITAMQKGNDQFKPAAPVSHTLTVSRSLTPNSLDEITGPTVDPALSPNGDGKNDVLTITNIEMYPDNKLSVISTNGEGVYETSGYNNQSKAFDGTSIIDGKKQKPGTYYYRLEYKDNGVVKSKTGYIVIKY